MVFTKMHGCGNDYIYIDCTKEFVENEEKAAIILSDRHFGVGGDGIILIKKGTKADFEMVMYNADGSRGAMCGNGIRCVAKYCYDHKLTDKTSFTIESMGAVKYIDVNVKNILSSYEHVEHFIFSTLSGAIKKKKPSMYF